MNFIIPKLGSYKSVDELEKQLILKGFEKSLSDNRGKFPIAVIDDESFSPQEYLGRHNYSITHLRDVSTLDSLQRYKIILCDLIGVGSMLNPTLQGAHIVVEIKKNYPEKIVVSYTGGGQRELLEKSIAASDYYLKKDANVEDWCEVLDKAISDLANPATVWRKFRHRLLDAGVTPYQLTHIEDVFVRTSLEGRDFSLDILNKESARLKFSSNVRAMLERLLVHAGFELAKQYIVSRS